MLFLNYLSEKRDGEVGGLGDGEKNIDREMRGLGDGVTKKISLRVTPSPRPVRLINQSVII
jgi:hypothetical protein